MHDSETAEEIALPAQVDDAHPAAALTALQKLCYGAGDLAISATWGLSTGYLLLYWSDVALVPVVALGPIMLSTRVLDAIFDPLVGALVDRTQTRFGKARPYLLWGALPFAALSVAVFTVPQFSPTLKIAYAIISFTTLGFLYSLLYIPYGALLPMLTRDRNERVQLASYRSMGTSLASLLVYSMTLPIVGAADPGHRQVGFTAVAVLMGAITVALLLGVTYPNTRELKAPRTHRQRLPLSMALRQITTNPAWMVASAISILLLAKMFSMVSAFPYFAREVLGSISWMTRILPLVSLMIFAGGFAASRFFKRIGLRIGNIALLAISIGLTALMPLFQRHPLVFFSIFLLSQFGGAFQAATIFILVADAVDLQSERHGFRSEGLMMSSVAFASKLGMAVGTALTGFVLAWTHYLPGTPSRETGRAISFLFYGFPILSMLLMILCLIPYRRDDVRLAKSRSSSGQ
jgi:GPH family glycoside/pentoside/hexuronide:cation symporter